jgi:hypothetical protein
MPPPTTASAARSDLGCIEDKYELKKGCGETTGQRSKLNFAVSSTGSPQRAVSQPREPDQSDTPRRRFWRYSTADQRLCVLLIKLAVTADAGYPHVPHLEDKGQPTGAAERAACETAAARRPPRRDHAER